MYEQTPEIVLTYPQYFQAYNTSRRTRWVRVFNGKGPAFFIAMPDTHLNVRPVATVATAEARRGRGVARGRAVPTAARPPSHDERPPFANGVLAGSLTVMYPAPRTRLGLRATRPAPESEGAQVMNLAVVLQSRGNAVAGERATRRWRADGPMRSASPHVFPITPAVRRRSWAPAGDPAASDRTEPQEDR